ncbi:hypothetical protein V501_08843 [Pseudogymnoascus sp. VKM F-4519 (FW-2642)]|nr:hypothetical protein V501_08843 [Pseudogymnoascus sp. VKM F-4519 (FW-2642)]
MAGNIGRASFLPASTISQALVFVLGACKNVSEKYDQIASFYETVIIFCERLAILQGRMPLENAFRSQLVGLLGTILNMCGIAQTVTGEGRMLTFTKTMFQSDEGLAGAYDEFNNQMSHFESAIITATLGISVQTDRGVENLQEMSRETQSLLRTVLWSVSMLPRQEIVFGAMGNHRNDSEREYRGVRSQRNNSNDTTYENKLTDIGQRRFNGSEGSLKRLSTGAELSLRQHIAEMGYAYIQNTCVWLHEAKEFKDFKDLKEGMLRYSGREEFKGEITADSVMRVSREFWRDAYNAQDYKCLAMASRYKGDYKEALSNAELGLKVNPDDDWTKCELWDRIGRINFGEVEDSYRRENDEGKLEEALKNLEEAITYGEKCSKDKEKEKVERTKQLKLKIEIQLNSSCEEEKRILAVISGALEIIFFDDIVRDIAERAQRDRGHWDNMHLLLNGVSDTQLSDGCKKETHKFIQYSAQGNTSVLKRIKVLYDKAIETLEKQQNSQLLGSTLLWRAIFWRFYSLPGSDGKKERAEQSFATKTFASWQLMDYYFEEFCRPLANEEVEDYLSRKEKAQGSMEHVIKWFSGIQDPDFGVSLSPLSIPLAIIYRGTKQEKKFFEEVDKTFHSCYKALTDNVIYNDKPSYMMLAKILALLGLEEQSRAAFKNWCLVSSDLNIDDRGQREKADRTRSRKVEKPNHKPSKINVECNGPCGTKMDNFDEDNPVLAKDK